MWMINSECLGCSYLDRKELSASTMLQLACRPAQSAANPTISDQELETDHKPEGLI